MNPDRYLRDLIACHRARGEPEPKRCPAGFDTLVLAPDGSVSSCRESQTREILGAGGVPLTLREAWRHPRVPGWQRAWARMLPNALSHRWSRAGDGCSTRLGNGSSAGSLVKKRQGAQVGTASMRETEQKLADGAFS